MKPKRKNLVICADGTGNSGGIGNVTNVWRLVNAVDVNDPTLNQIAFHDDGVGTNKNILIRSLGLAFGLGLSKNIRELYRNVVIQYDENTRLYLFGFSRGAHTIRLLAEMICTFGVLKRKSFKNEKQLDKAIKELHSTFKSAIRKAWLLKVFSIFSQTTPKKLSQRTQRSISQKINRHRIKLNDLLELDVADDVTEHLYDDVKIKLVGVWDTVSAMGMPVDELRDNIFFAGHAFVDNSLHKNVEHGRQALAIDEMRQTFKPELWNQKSGNGEDIKQVWFSGVHSNIGGGYPKDELSLVSLNWMMSEATRLGLKFIPDKEKEVKQAANPNGTMYNSRSGIANIYRFKPRNIELLTQEFMSSDPTQPLIHESVYKRIMDSPARYSPFNLPNDVDDQSVESQDTEDKIKRLIEKSWNIVSWHSFLHYVFLITLAGFFGLGYYLTKQAPPLNDLSADHIVHFVSLLKSLLIQLSHQNFLYIGEKVIPGYVNNLPILGGVLSSILSLFLYRKYLLSRLKNIGNIFWNIEPFEKNRVAAKETQNRFIHKLIFSAVSFFRSSYYITQKFTPFIKHTIVPIVATGVFLALIFFSIQYLAVPKLNHHVYIETLFLLLFPFLVFYSFSRAMVSLSKHDFVTNLLESTLPGKKQLYEMRKPYGPEYASHLWGAISKDHRAIESEEAMLRIDLIFPLIYSLGFLLPFRHLWNKLGEPILFYWLLAPIGLLILSDWIENSIHIHQFKRFIEGGKNSLSNLLMTISSLATRAKIYFFIFNALVLLTLIGARLAQL